MCTFGSHGCIYHNVLDCYATVAANKPTSRPWTRFGLWPDLHTKWRGIDALFCLYIMYKGHIRLCTQTLHTNNVHKKIVLVVYLTIFQSCFFCVQLVISTAQEGMLRKTDHGVKSRLWTVNDCHYVRCTLFNEEANRGWKTMVAS